ncbi:unnamed protein product, partial [Prorocentrum cordatum]
MLKSVAAAQSPSFVAHGVAYHPRSWPWSCPRLPRTTAPSLLPGAAQMMKATCPGARAAAPPGSAPGWVQPAVTAPTRPRASRPAPGCHPPCPSRPRAAVRPRG